MLDGPLPFELRPRKLAQLSGEATRKLAKLATAAGSREDRDEAVAWRAAVLRSQTYTDEALAAALRRFDLDGYGSVKLAVFECALEAVGVALDRGAAGRFFEALDVNRSRRCDAEVLVALCGHWRRSARSTTPPTDAPPPPHGPYDAEVAAFQEDARAFARQLGDACERLDASGCGALSYDAVRLACLDAGVAVPSRRALERAAAAGGVARRDGLFEYRALLRCDDADAMGEHHGAVWRRAAGAWAAGRAGLHGSERFDLRRLAAVLGGSGAPLGRDDASELWRSAARGQRSTSASALDAYFAVPDAPVVPAAVPTTTRWRAPFAVDGDPRERWVPPKHLARRPGMRRADDETDDAWSAQVTYLDHGAADAAALEHFESARTEPPFWTEGATLEAPDVGGRRHNAAGWEKTRGDSAARPYYADVFADPGPAAGWERTDEGLLEKVPDLALRLREACAADPALAESALCQFRTGPPSLDRGEIISLAQHLGCVPITKGGVDRVARWIDRGALRSDAHDVDGSHLGCRENAIRVLLDLPVVTHLDAAAAARERRRRERNRGGTSHLTVRTPYPDLAFRLTEQQRRACYRVMRRANAVVARCAAYDLDGHGAVTPEALDSALRDGSLLPETDERRDVVEYITEDDGRVRYASIYATLQKRLDDDAALSPGAPRPRPRPPAPHPRGSQEARGAMPSRCTQDKLAARPPASSVADAPALSGWRGSDGAPPLKGRSDDGCRAKHADDLLGQHVGSGVTSAASAEDADGTFADVGHIHRRPGAATDDLLEWRRPPTPERPRRFVDDPAAWEPADTESREAGVPLDHGDDLDHDRERDLRNAARATPEDAARAAVLAKFDASKTLGARPSPATAAVRLRHAFRRHAKRGASPGGGALLLVAARGGGAGAAPGGGVAATTDVDQVLRELGVDLDGAELACLVGDAGAATDDPRFVLVDALIVHVVEIVTRGG